VANVVLKSIADNKIITVGSRPNTKYIIQAIQTVKANAEIFSIIAWLIKL